MQAEIVIRLPFSASYSREFLREAYEREYTTALLEGSLDTSITIIPPPTSRSKKCYRFACVGGTFDHLHGGHKLLLTVAIEVSHSLLIGLVASPSMLMHKRYSELIESFETRSSQIGLFMQHIGFKNYRVVPLESKYGDAVIDASLEAIIVTEETRPAAISSNRYLGL